jgi:hypothetical protein
MVMLRKVRSSPPNQQSSAKDILMLSDSNVVFTIAAINATLQEVMLIFYSTCLLSCFRKDGLLLQLSDFKEEII